MGSLGRGKKKKKNPPWPPPPLPRPSPPAAPPASHCFLFFLIFYCLAQPCPALAPALPYFEFSFCCQGQEEEVIQGTGSVFFHFTTRDRRRKLHRERAVFFFPFAARDRRRKLQRELFFLLMPGTGGGSYTGNFFSFCCQGQEEEVTLCTAHPVLP
jgi:hypothetical protein